MWPRRSRARSGIRSAYALRPRHSLAKNERALGSSNRAMLSPNGPGGSDDMIANERGGWMRMLRGVARGALALIVVACGGDSGGGAGGGAGTVVVGMRSDFGGFNPVTSSGQYDMEVMNYALFTPLVQYDENLGVQPYLAESWEMHGDTGVTFKLRNDVRWHDGQPVTAHDVKFTFDLAKDEVTASLIGSAF